MQRIHTVPQDLDGQPLQIALYALGYTRRQIREMKRSDAIQVDGQRRFANQPVRAGECITLTLPRFESEAELTDEPQLPVPEILYQDEAIAVVFKPHHLLVHPAPNSYAGNDTMQDRLRQALHRPVHAVHRLDGDTEGVMVLALLPYAQATLQKEMAQGRFFKSYEALVFGQVPPCGLICAPIERITPDSFTRVVRSDGKSAQTAYTRLALYDAGPAPVSRVRLHPLTGRTHQLRVHMQYLGCPILGDPRYFTPDSQAYARSCNLTQLCLCASELSFFHPLTGKKMTFCHAPTFPFPAEAFPEDPVSDRPSQKKASDGPINAI